MRRAHKTLAGLLCAALVLTGISFTGSIQQVLADETEESETLTYEYEGITYTYEAEDDEITITGCADEDAAATVTELTLPAEIEGAEVTAIGSSAFNGYTALTQVTMSDSIESIGRRAFYDCTSLLTIDFSDSLTSIDMYAFYNCQSLTELLFPDSLTVIYEYAFYGCTDISYIRLPASDLSLRDNNFGQSMSVETVEYAEGCTKPYTSDQWQNGMGFLAYVKTVILPSTITSLNTGTMASGYEGAINDTYFSAFQSVEEFIIAEDNPYFTTYDNCIYDIDLTTLYMVPKAAQSVEFAPGCETIKCGSFSSCNSITEVTVPDSVNLIEGTVSCTDTDYGAFTSCEALETIAIPESVETIEAGAIKECDSLTDVSFYIDGVYYHFTGENSEYVKEITQLEIADGSSTAAEITDAAFEVFTVTSSEEDSDDTEEYSSVEAALETIIFPSGTSSIQQDLFDYMSSLVSIEVSSDNSTYYSENGVLYKYNDSGLTLVRYPIALGSVNYADGLTSIGELAFYKCDTVSSFEFPETLTEVGAQAFYKMLNIDVTFAEGLTSIGDEAFYGCLNSSVYLPESVTSIGTNAFYTLDASLTLTLAAGSYAEEYAIANGLTYVTYGGTQTAEETEETGETNETKETNGTNDTNENVSAAAAKGAAVGTKVTVSGLTYKVTSSSAVTVTGTTKKNASKVTIPATVKINGKSYKVTQISASAFAKNKKLKTVVIGKNVKTIGKKAFYNCKNLKKITFKGKNVKTIGAKAFKGTAKKATVKVPKAKKAAYQKLLKKAGLASAAKIK